MIDDTYHAGYIDGWCDATKGVHLAVTNAQIRTDAAHQEAHDADDYTIRRLNQTINAQDDVISVLNATIAQDTEQVRGILRNIQTALDA